MLRRLTTGNILAACVAVAMCPWSGTSAADPTWRLNDRFSESHAAPDQRSADDLDFTINIPSDWLTGGGASADEEREIEVRRYVEDATGRESVTPAPRDGLELRFNGSARSRTPRGAPGSPLRFDRIGPTDLERPAITFTINKRF